MSSSLIGESVVMQRVFKAIGQAACSLQPTFLCGPPGSGKETVARTLHQATHEGGTLSFCYCPAVDRVDSWEEMWDETLARGKPFTLVLQEVSQLSLASQTRLVQRLALSESSREKPVQSTANGTRFRIVATSSAELTPAINSGQFRADLFYALSVHRIDLPPLRERLDDLPLLIRRFLNEGRGCMTREGDSGTRLSPSVLQTLGAYTWPGNLDELSCFVKSCRGPLGGLQWIVPRLEDLRSRQVKKNSRDSTAAHGDQPKIASIDSDSLGTNWQEFVTEQLKVGTQDLYATAIAEAESKFLQLVLHHTQGNQARAARILGITRASLRKKIRSLHLAIG